MLDANKLGPALGAGARPASDSPDNRLSFSDPGDVIQQRRVTGAPTQDTPPTPPSMKQMMAAAEEPERPHFDATDEVTDDELWPGGPRQSLLDSWKKQFEGKVFLTQIDEDDSRTWFVWHTLKRLVYRQILSVPNVDPLMREEMICEACVLWPLNFSHETQATNDAGVASLLSEQIMEKSGFARASVPIAL